MTEDAVYVYAVSRVLEDADVRGCAALGPAPVRIVHHRGLAAAVSDVDLAEFGEDGLRRNLEDLAWVERVARGHDGVVQAIGARRPTAPLRLGTVYFDDDGVRARLDELHEPLTAALDRVEGRAEWGVKVTVPPPAETTPETRPAETGAAYLRRRREETTRRESAAQHASEVAEDVHRRLSDVVVASRRLPPQDSRLTGDPATMVLNGAYLVDRTRAAPFQELVEQVRQDLPEVRVDLGGPWTPYSFVTLD